MSGITHIDLIYELYTAYLTQKTTCFFLIKKTIKQRII
jgi:hypothetical protein